MGSWRLPKKSTIVKKKDTVPAVSGCLTMGAGDRTTTRNHWALS